MHKVISFFFLFFYPSILVAAPLPDYPPLLTYMLFPGGLEVIDGSTVLVTANGINKEISLNGTWEDDEKGKEILKKMIAGRSTEVRIYGCDKDNRTVGVLFADGENISQELTGGGFAQKWFYHDYNEVGKEYFSISMEGVRIPSSNSVSSSGGNYREKTQRVSAYTRKDGTRVESYMRAPARR
ncbi:hypothetical protein KKHLCK_05925 [Candidatus Electrothrix laxa]